LETNQSVEDNLARVNFDPEIEEEAPAASFAIAFSVLMMSFQELSNIPSTPQCVLSLLFYGRLEGIGCILSGQKRRFTRPRRISRLILWNRLKKSLTKSKGAKGRWLI